MCKGVALPQSALAALAPAVTVATTSTSTLIPISALVTRPCRQPGRLFEVEGHPHCGPGFGDALRAVESDRGVPHALRADRSIAPGALDVRLAFRMPIAGRSVDVSHRTLLHRGRPDPRTLRTPWFTQLSLYGGGGGPIGSWDAPQPPILVIGLYKQLLSFRFLITVVMRRFRGFRPARVQSAIILFIAELPPWCADRPRREV